MPATGEEDGNRPHPPEIQEIKGPQAIETIMNYCQIIFRTVKRLEKRFDKLDEKLTKIYQARPRSFWHYPPFKSATRKYNYLKYKRLKVQKVSEVVHDDSFTYTPSYSPTSPVCRREQYNQDMENMEPMDCALPLQYTDTINNIQTFQYTDTIDNSQTIQYTDTVDLSQTVQYTDSVDLDQTVQYTDSVDLDQTVQYTDSVDLDQTVQYTDAVDLDQTIQYTDAVDLDQTIQYTDSVDLDQTIQYTDSVDLDQTIQYTDTVNNTIGIQNTENNDASHSENSQDSHLVTSSPERDYQETPPSPTYTIHSYEEYYRFRNVPGSSTLPFYSDIEIPNMDTIRSASSTPSEASTLPPGELIPIKNPEMRRMALKEARLSPMIDPNTFGSSPECTNAVMRNLGCPVNWSVNDVISFLNRLDPPFADQLYPTIIKHAIDGKALLLISRDTMIKYMAVKVGVAVKLENYIKKLKENVDCGQ